MIDQIRLTTLLATATADVVKYFEGLTDFDIEKVSGLQFVEEVTSAFGSRDAVEEAKRQFVENFPDFKEKIRALMVSMAEGEIAAAVNAANEECIAHAERLTVLREIHDGMLKAIDEHPLPASKFEDVDKDFAEFIERSNADLREHVEKGHQDLMAIVREKHLLNLEYCFRGHLVTEATAKELALLHEVKE